jgi:hypothetical protein
VISDADVAAADVDPLDVRADPSRPGRNLPPITRMTNPSLERELRDAIKAIYAAATAEREEAARQRRHVRAAALDDAMARLEIEAGQDAVAAVMNDLDSAVASAKAVGDIRTADQIRADQAIYRLTGGAFGQTACPARAAERAEGAERAERAEPTEQPAAATEADAAGPSEPGDPADVADQATSAPDIPASFAVIQPQHCPCGELAARPALAVSLVMGLSTWLGLAEDPAVLDRYGSISAALARQIARDAARDHPTTTTWRCVITDDAHATVLGVGDPLRTPRHDPPPRLARLVTAMHPRCTFPGCATQARRCEIDHRVAYDHGDASACGPTCSCNLHPLCGAHHRLKTAGLIEPSPVSSGDGTTRLGALVWRTATGHSYRYDPPRPTPARADPDDVALAAAARGRQRTMRDRIVEADPDRARHRPPECRSTRTGPARSGRNPCRLFVAQLHLRRHRRRGPSPPLPMSRRSEDGANGLPRLRAWQTTLDQTDAKRASPKDATSSSGVRPSARSASTSPISALNLKPSPESPHATTTPPGRVSITNRRSGDSVHEHTWASSATGSTPLRSRRTRSMIAWVVRSLGVLSTSSSTRSRNGRSIPTL